MSDLTPTALAITPRKVLAALVLVTIALCATSVFGQYLRFFHGIYSGSAFVFIDDFDVDEEANFPTYYNSMLLLVAASLLAVVARSLRLASDEMSTRWRVLAATFVVLSIDEVVGIHEAVGTLVPGTGALGGTLFSAWVIPYGIAVAILGLYFWPFLRDLPDPHRLRFIACALVYVGGALVVELAESAITSRTGDETWPYQLVATLQEFSEMIGASLFIWAILKFIEWRDPVLHATVQIGDSG